MRTKQEIIEESKLLYDDDMKEVYDIEQLKLEVLCDIRDQIAEHNNMMQAVINGKKAINVGGVVYNQV